MSETLDNNERENDEFPHYWHCPLCRYETRTVTKFGLLGLQQQHMRKHRDEKEDDSILMHTTVAPAVRRNYNVLKLNRSDAFFLKARYIKIDENIEIDWEDYGNGSKPKKGNM